jgi:ribosomal protein S18 acetylase RimI-like enzyme
MSVVLRELKGSDFEGVLTFTDTHIGRNYFSEEKLKKLFKASHRNNVNCSFVLEDSEGIKGLRLTFPPGQWSAEWIDRDTRQPTHPELWQTPADHVAYFQSLFIASQYQGEGWGERLSMASIENLKKLGARAVVCHSWDESPYNSSRKYLLKLGFQPLVSIPHYWKMIDYECTRCGQPCLCTATEMIFYI